MTSKEGALMKCTKFLGMWKSRYFVLDGNYLHYYPSQSHVGVRTDRACSAVLLLVVALLCFPPRPPPPPPPPHVARVCLCQLRGFAQSSKRKSMELTVGTVTAYTDTDCCFTVRNQKENWVLIAQDEDSMRDWISAINSHVHMEHLRTVEVP